MSTKFCQQTSAALLFTGIAIAASQGTAQANDSKWGVHTTGSIMRVTNCTNCGDDAAISFSCKAGGKLANVAIPGAASLKGSPGKVARVRFKIGGDRFTYTAKTRNHGEPGNVPTFALAPNDPLVDWLQSAKTASATFDGKKAAFDLNGSSKALKKFREFCGWNEPVAKQPLFTASIGESSDTHIPDYSQTVGIISPVLPDAEGRFWHTGDGFGGGSARELSYSLTDSYGELVSASCQTFGNQEVLLKTAFDLGRHSNGEGLMLEIRHDDGVSAFVGQADIREGIDASARFNIPADDPLWQSLAFSKTVSMRLRGGDPISLGGLSGSAAILEFSRACASRVAPVASAQANFLSPNFSLGTTNFTIGLK